MGENQNDYLPNLMSCKAFSRHDNVVVLPYCLARFIRPVLKPKKSIYWKAWIIKAE